MVIGRALLDLVTALAAQTRATRKPSARCSSSSCSSAVILGRRFIVSYAHTDADIDRTIDAVRDALVVYRRGLEKESRLYLEGRSDPTGRSSFQLSVR